ncbi:MAG: VCBS repeat-containing protein [Chromatiales bacterium]|nr:VCBS repeat-containing protein [Chromatiales bacterium]
MRGNRSYLTPLAAMLVVVVATGTVLAAGEACVRVFKRGVLALPYNAAFLGIATLDNPDGSRSDALLFSSFFNVVKDEATDEVDRFIVPDFAGLVRGIDGLDLQAFDPERDMEVLTDRGREQPLTVWPNKTDRVPDGVLPFEGIVVPGGFLAASAPGRIAIINLDDPERGEYVVVEAGTAPPVCRGGEFSNERWDYHKVVFLDVDGDGLPDIVTVRAAFQPFMFGCPPVGELVWFRNPGETLAPEVPWEERVLVGLPLEPGGPEINLDLADLNGDGSLEIIATHFLTSDAISIFGPPAGGNWADVDPAAGRPARSHVIMTGQGRPFGVQAVDLNLDGRLEVLATNHQGDGCFEVTDDEIPGRVIALQQPVSGRLFEDPWTVRILKDDIRPNPTYPPPARGPGRLAPNRAVAFWPVRALEGRVRPWVVVGGDEAPKVWVLRPPTWRGSNDWDYSSVAIFDINDHYGQGTTQRLTDDGRSVTLSTIGGLDWRYDRPGALGFAEIWAPVFEAGEVHVFSFRPLAGYPRISCPPDTGLSCGD